MSTVSNDHHVKRDIFVIGASTGGVDALRYLCAALPAGFPGIVGVVLHRSPMYDTDPTAIYQKAGGITVCEPDHGTPLTRGTLYFAPRDRHMLFHPDLVELSHGPKEHFTRPAIDPLFTSAASSFGDRVVGIVLTGGGMDGVRGLMSIKAKQGLSVIQDPREARNPSMPVSALRDDHVDMVARLADLPAWMCDLAQGGKQSGPVVGTKGILMRGPG
jgi:two-component system chemotaxis response regulator CheB